MADSTTGYLGNYNLANNDVYTNMGNPTDAEKKKAQSDANKNLLGDVAGGLIKDTVLSPIISTDKDTAAGYGNIKKSYLDLANINPDDLKVQFDKYLAVAAPDLQREGNIDLGASQFTDVALDPRLKQNLENQIATFQKLGASGYTPEMAAAANQIQRQNQAQAASQMAAVQQSMDARGMGGAGIGAALQAQAAQSAANRAAQQAEDMSSTAYRNQIAALGQGNQAMQNLASSDLSASINRAQGMDLQSRAQGTLRADIQRQNTQAANALNQANWMNQQNVGNANTKTQQEQELQNKVGAIKTAADIKLGALSGATGAQTGQGQAGHTAAQESGSKAGIDLGSIVNIGKDLVSNPDIVKNVTSWFT